MRTAVSAVARMFLRVFIAAVVVYLIGVLEAPDLNTARSIAIAGLVAGAAAVLRFATVYIPKITVAHWIGDPWGSLADSFIHAFLAALIVNALDWLKVPHFHGWRDLWVAIIVGVAGAAVRAVQGLFTTGEFPLPSFGLPEPKSSASNAPVAAPPPPTKQVAA
jgi:hypothetical protein